MSEPNVHAKRAVQRKNARNAGRVQSMTEVQRLRLQVRILADRLALALHLMCDHEQFIRFNTTAEQMDYLEQWVERLLLVEQPPKPGHKWPFDFWRKMQRYRYIKQSLRALLRNQIRVMQGFDDDFDEGEQQHVADATDAA